MSAKPPSLREVAANEAVALNRLVDLLTLMREATNASPIFVNGHSVDSFNVFDHFARCIQASADALNDAVEVSTRPRKPRTPKPPKPKLRVVPSEPTAA